MTFTQVRCLVLSFSYATLSPPR